MSCCHIDPLHVYHEMEIQSVFRLYNNTDNNNHIINNNNNSNAQYIYIDKSSYNKCASVIRIPRAFELWA